MRVEDMTLGEWRDALPSDGFEFFHDADALAVIADHAGGTLRLFGAFKGQEAVGLLPVFVRDVPLGRVVVSPPPSLGVPFLGPLLMPNSPKRRKRESLNRRFVGEVLDVLDADARGTMLRLVCSPSYADPRPFAWGDQSIEPRFTYRVDVGDRELSDVTASFSSSLRKEMRRGRDLDVTVDVEGIDAAHRIYDDVDARHEEQGETFAVPRGLVESFVSDFDDDRSRVYVARDGDGAYLSGIVVLFSNDVAYYWQGGARAEHDGVSVNSLIHWHVLRDVSEDPALSSVSAYDLVGANTERLCTYKGQFGGSLVPYYAVESSGVGTAAAKRVFRLVGK